MSTATVFKAYDIRGTYPDQLDAQFAERLGRAFVTYLVQNYPAMLIAKEVVVGEDMRSSSPILREALVRGLTASGVSVRYIGMIATEQLYHACGSLGRAGITVSASHNPKQYNGFKMVAQLPELVSGAAIREVFEAGEFVTVGRVGTVTNADLSLAYVAKVLSLVKTEAFLPLEIVVDTANGMGGPAVEKVFADLPFKLTKLFFEPDGAFPNHPADPLLPANRVVLEARVKADGADFGLAFDGDADRCFVIDEAGEMVPGDFLTALLAERMLAGMPRGTAVVYDARASWAVSDRIRSAGGRPVIERVGHANIKPRMKQENAIFGGEISGHYYYRDFYYSDSGLITALKVCELVSTSGKSLRELWEPLRNNYFISGEINSTVADAASAMKRVEATYADAKISHLDGVSIEYPDWHCNVRSSNTEPLLRLNLEARSRELMEQKREEVLALIRS